MLCILRTNTLEMEGQELLIPVKSALCPEPVWPESSWVRHMGSSESPDGPRPEAGEALGFLLSCSCGKGRQKLPPGHLEFINRPPTIWIQGAFSPGIMVSIRDANVHNTSLAIPQRLSPLQWSLPGETSPPEWTET